MLVQGSPGAQASADRELERCSGAAFEALLEARLILRNLLPGLHPGEGRYQLAHAMAFQVEPHGDARTATSGLHRHRPDRAHRTVDPSERCLTRRLVLGDLVGDRTRAAGHAPDVGCP